VALCPFATIGLLASASAGGPWVRPSTRSSNRPSNRPTNRPSIQPTQIVVHTLESTARAADWRFRRAETLGQAAGQSHFGVGRDGTIVQWIDTGSRADATHQANRRADGTGAVALTTEPFLLIEGILQNQDRTVSVKAGAESAPVYGRAYPEPEAYPETIAYQPISPLEYTMKPGQSYAVTDLTPVTDYYRAWSFDGSIPGDRTDVVGQDRYYQIQLAHRMVFVRAADVELHR